MSPLQRYGGAAEALVSDHQEGSGPSPSQVRPDSEAGRGLACKSRSRARGRGRIAPRPRRADDGAAKNPVILQPVSDASAPLFLLTRPVRPWRWQGGPAGGGCRCGGGGVGSGGSECSGIIAPRGLSTPAAQRAWRPAQGRAPAHHQACLGPLPAKCASTVGVRRSRGGGGTRRPRRARPSVGGSLPHVRASEALRPRRRNGRPVRRLHPGGGAPSRRSALGARIAGRRPLRPWGPCAGPHDRGGWARSTSWCPSPWEAPLSGTPPARAACERSQLSSRVQSRDRPAP